MSGIAESRRREIEEQLERIVSSATFSGSERHRKFLRFVVEQALKGDTDKLNEFVLGFEVFNKNESFDPRIDSIVRVEARRLRERLKKYYEEEGRGDRLIVTLRPRSFVPEFRDLSDAQAPAEEKLRGWLLSHKALAAIVAGAVLFGAAVTAGLLWYRGRKAAPQSASILVVPFQTFSSVAGQELLGDAIADAIITGLAGSPGLRVISRGSGIEFKESGRSPFQFAADLQVDYIVEGTVHTDAVRARVSAKMTDVRTQSYVWAATREARLESIGELERELTDGISSRIRIPQPPDSRERVVRRRAANWKAYAAFLKGQYYWYQQTPGSAEKSVELFQEATRGDPNYAPAWAWLAQGYQLLILRSQGRDAGLIAQGRQAAQKALALDEQLAEAHAAVGSYAALDWDWKTAEREFRRAIELNPEWAPGHLMYSMLYLVPTGQMRAAVREMLRAHELDPLTGITRAMLAEVMYFNREYARAIAETEDMRKGVGRPSPNDRRYFLALSLSGQGDRALAEVSRTITDQAPPPALALLGYLQARHGDRRPAMAIRQRLVERLKEDPGATLLIAMISVGLGDNRDALQRLRAAVAGHQPAMSQAVADPVFDPLHSDPQYAEILKAMGLESRLGK